MKVNCVGNNLHITLTNFKNESRVLKEAASLLRHGVVGIVYVAALQEESLAIDQSYGDRLIAKRFKLITRNMPKNLIAQIAKYIEFSLQVYSHYKNKNIKIINVHSLGLLPLGVTLKILYGAKLIYDAHELETEKNGDRGFRKVLSKFVERLLIKRVEMTIVVSESIADWYQKTYCIERPLVILNAPNHRDLIKTSHFRDALGIRTDQIILLYQGLLAAGRGINLIIQALMSRADDKVVVVFMGYGSMVEEINYYTSQNDCIFYFPAVSPDVVLEYTASADFGLALIENTCLSYYYCMPNKLLEYAMSGLPILVSNLKDMALLVDKYKMGIIVRDYNVSGFNSAIDALLKTNLDEMRSNAYRAANDLEWEVQEIKLINSYKQIN